MSNGEPEAGSARLPEIDAIRGLAALTVVFYHFAAMFRYSIYHFDKQGSIVWNSAYIIMTALRPLYSGEEAVILFFILSGFVLSLPSLAGRGQTYPVFVCRRIFRIYLPYLAALALAILGNVVWHGPLGRGSWADATWLYPVKWQMVVQHVLFLGEYPTATFNTAFWSLVVEMRVSLVFPLLFVLTMRVRRHMGSFLLLCMSCPVLVVAVERIGHHQLTNTEFTLRYIGMFAIGILAASYKEEIRRRLSTTIDGRCAGALLLASIALYSYGWFVLGRYVPATFAVWVPAAGALGIVCLGIGWAPMAALLRTSLPQFLGKISYSLYLVHGTVLFTLAHICGAKYPFYVTFAIYLPLTLISAWAMYCCVERPATEYGRRVSRKIGERARRPVFARA